MSDPVNVKLIIPSLADFVGVARLTASGVANRMKFPHEDIEDIKIAVSEACTNAVQYAYGDQVGDIALTFSISEDLLKISVKDSGQGFDSDEKRPETAVTDNEKVGLGLGIVFMRSLMDKVEYQSSDTDGTEVVMTKKLPPLRA